jgi:hypothetical protein
MGYDGITDPLRRAWSVEAAPGLDHAHAKCAT